MSLSSLEPRFQEVLNVLPGVNPCGEFIRYTSFYDALQQARHGDTEETLPEGVWQSDVKKVDWFKVVDLCLSILTEKSKDLQVGVWLTEALFFTDGLDGLERGMQLLNELSLKFWDDLYPLPEDGDLEIRLAPYDWLDYHLPSSVLLLMVTQPLSKDLLCYSLADWIDASHFELLNRKKNDSQNLQPPQGRLVFSDVVASLRKTPLAFYTHMDQKAQAVLKLSDILNSTIGQKIGAQVSLFFRLKGQINLLLKHLGTWKTQSQKNENGTQEQIPSPIPETPLESIVFEDSPLIQPQKRLHSRAEAYDTLGQIADFLLAQDPHSPTPYLLKRAIGWEEKSLPEVYSDWSQNPEELMFLMRFLGVKGGKS